MADDKFEDARQAQRAAQDSLDAAQVDKRRASLRDPGRDTSAETAAGAKRTWKTEP